MAKLRVGILFGGRSSEHEVSLQSAKSIVEAIDKEKYEPILIGIDKSGKWHLADQANYLLNASDPALIKLNASSTNVALLPGASEGSVMNIANGSAVGSVDVVFPVLHGLYGEDGTIQGLLKLANVPFVGADVLGSAIGIDKDIMKRLLRDAGLPSAKFLSFTASEKEHIDYDEITTKLGSPVFVKPANAGSSVGVAKAKTKEEFEKAVTDAFSFDNKVIVEQSVKGREIECAVLGNDMPEASVPGEIILHDHEFYSYEAKYIDLAGAETKIPADLPVETVDRLRALAIQTFKTLSCFGMARVDFFLTEDGMLYVNEINTIPGFTKISMYPKLWEASGLSYTKLIDRLIELAIERHQTEQRLKTNYIE